VGEELHMTTGKKRNAKPDYRKYINEVLREARDSQEYKQLILPQVEMVVLDPLYGSIRIPPDIQTIIDTEKFQRMRGLRQLGLTHMVYPGATHTRFAHSIGTWHLSRLLLENLYIKNQTVDSHVARLFLYATLLHDVGHYPFSHAIEDAFSRRGKRGYTHEKRTRDMLSDTTRNGFFYPIRQKLNLTKTDTKIIAYITVDDVSADEKLKKLCKEASSKPDESSTNRLVKLKNIFHEILDRVDYLLRDSYYCGVKYGDFDFERLLNSVDFGDHGDKNYRVYVKGIEPLFSLYLGRFQMYKIVYNHKTVRAIHCMLKQAFGELENIGELNIDVSTCSDDQLLHVLSCDDGWISRLDKQTSPSSNLIQVFHSLHKESKEEAIRRFIMHCLGRRRLFERLITFKPRDFVIDRDDVGVDEAQEILRKIRKGNEKAPIERFRRKYTHEVLKNLKENLTRHLSEDGCSVLEDILVLFDFPKFEKKDFQKMNLFSEEFNKEYTESVDTRFRDEVEKFYSMQKAFRVFVLDLFDTPEFLGGADTREEKMRELRSLWNDCISKEFEGLIPEAKNVLQ
jgi:HD superfamily phosphohydrolase